MRKNKKMSVEELKVIMFDKVFNISQDETLSSEERDNAVFVELVVYGKLLNSIERFLQGSGSKGAHRRYGK